MRILRVLKGIAVSAAVWTVALVPISLALVAIEALFSTVPISGTYWRAFLLTRLVTGAINGAVFGVLLATLSRRHEFATLSVRRVMVLGAIGGSIYPLINIGMIIRHAATSPYWTGPLFVPGMAIMVAVNCALGAIWAGAALKLARRVPELPDSSDGDHKELASGAAVEQSVAV